MNEREAFEQWLKKEHPHIYSGSLKDNDDSIRFKMDVDFMFVAWLASANRDGYKLVPTGDTNIADMIWGKCLCGSSMSPIISDKVGYNLIHCFACGANKYIHKDY